MSETTRDSVSGIVMLSVYLSERSWQTRCWTDLGKICKLHAGVWFDDVDDVLGAKGAEKIVDEVLYEWVVGDGGSICCEINLHPYR